MSKSRVALSPMDNIMPRFYARLVYCFRTKSNIESHIILETLQKGLAGACEDLPVLTGKVFASHPSAEDPTKGRLELEFDPQRIPQIAFNDLSETWDYDDLMDAGMPQDDMDGDVLFPPASIPDLNEGAPAFIAQANILAGGLLLSAGFFHSIIDGTSGMWVCKLWSQHVRRIQESQGTGSVLAFEPDSHRTDLLTKYWLSEGNTQISSKELEANPGEEELWRLLGLNPLKKSQPAFSLAPEIDGVTAKAPEMRATIFYFSQRAFLDLKHDASDGEIESGISANDALMALLWKGILGARFPYSQNNTEGQPHDAILDTTFDGRTSFSSHLPWSYLGTLIFISTTRLPISELVAPETPLSKIAKSIRKSNDEITKERLHAAYQIAAAIPDYNNITFPFASFIEPEICITSWIALSLLDLDFGDIFANNGRPELLRVPRREFDAVCRRCVVLPLQKQGGFEVTISLPKEEMLRLEKDPLFSKYAKVVCH